MPRYRSFSEHLDARVGPKRILALDGGGLRGVMTLGMLREIETQLRACNGGDPAFRLCDAFDLIAGTSTGSIIAAALALGMTVDEVHGHYMKLGDKVFKTSLLRWGPLRALRAKFDAADVAAALKGVFGERRMDSADFRTGLLVMAKRLDSGSPWPITNNPGATYFRGGTRRHTVPNAEYPLWQVVRASTAAPSFFDPESIEIARADPARNLLALAGNFVDGGVSPHNNPALQAVMTATMQGFKLEWPTGADRLQVVSVGTGKPNPVQGPQTLVTGNPLVHAVLSLAALMEDCSDTVETVMQWLSQSPTARRIDREILEAGPPLGGRAMFGYLRYNVLLTPEWVAEQLGESFDAPGLARLEAMDDPGMIPELDRIGRLAGRKLVQAGHFGAAFDARVA